MEDVSAILTAFKADSAKKRERAIKELSTDALQDPRIIEALQKIAKSDSIEYVRVAATTQLINAGRIQLPIDPITYRLEVEKGTVMSSQIATLLDNLSVGSAKQRERVIKEIPTSSLQDENLVKVLHVVATRDPVEYVRIAAQNALAKVGQSSQESLTPITVKQDSTIETAKHIYGGTFGLVILLIGVMLTIGLMLFGLVALLYQR